MKFTCEKALLQAAIQIASRAVSPKSSIPALEGILFEAENSLVLTGYNLETGIRTRCEAEVLRPGSIVLPARLISELVRRLPDDIVHVSVEKLSVSIHCGFSDFQLQALDPEEFPHLPEVDQTHSFSMEERALKSMISDTLFAVSDNESRPIHTGSLFEVTAEEVTMISVDGFRLALRREVPRSCEGAFDFVAPGAALSEVEKICRDTDEEAAVIMGNRHLLFQIGNSTLISRRLEGEFLAWRRAIPRENPVKVTVETKELLRSIERVSLIISEKLKSPLRCVFGENELKLSTKTGIGEASDNCLTQGSGGGLEIGFNNRYMIDALRAAPADSVRIELSSGVSPCVILPAEGEERFVYMVLPVRLKNDQI